MESTNGAKQDLVVMERQLANGFTLRCVVRIWVNPKDKPTGPSWYLLHKDLDKQVDVTDATALALILERKGR
jgi:hypothetical protein